MTGQTKTTNILGTEKIGGFYAERVTWNMTNKNLVIEDYINTTQRHADKTLKQELKELASS